ncbi:hypothetical protein ACFQ60_47975 [Streptomyces zhihengii]
MNPEDIPWMPAVALAARIKAREVSATEVAEAIVTRIETLNPSSMRSSASILSR